MADATKPVRSSREGSVPSTETCTTGATDSARQTEDSLTVLRGAFPDVDLSVVKAVLNASGGRVQVAFDALLGMSDPDFQPGTGPIASAAPEDEERRRQVEADEHLARQMVAETAYSRAHRDRQARRAERSGSQQQQQQGDRTGAEHSFLDDDLPVIRDNIVQGFNETRVKVNSFLSNLRAQYAQRFEGEDTTEPDRSGALPNTRPTAPTSQKSRYESDAEQIDMAGSDLHRLNLEDTAQATATNSSQTASSVSEMAAPVGVKKTSKWQPLPANPTSGSQAAEAKRDQFDIGDDD